MVPKPCGVAAGAVSGTRLRNKFSDNVQMGFGLVRKRHGCHRPICTGPMVWGTRGRPTAPSCCRRRSPPPWPSLATPAAAPRTPGQKEWCGRNAGAGSIVDRAWGRVAERSHAIIFILFVFCHHHQVPEAQRRAARKEGAEGPEGASLDDKAKTKRVVRTKRRNARPSGGEGCRAKPRCDDPSNRVQSSTSCGSN